VLAAAGCWLQLLTVDHAQQPPAAAAAGAGTGAFEANAWQQQQQQLKMTWVTVEEFLQSSCVGASSSSSSSSSTSGRQIASAEQLITADAVAGGKQLYDNPITDAAAVADAAEPPGENCISARSGYRIVTAVWLPYGNDACELFWSYKVALRHANSHALVNAAAWFRFQQEPEVVAGSNSSSSSSSRKSGLGSSCFAGRTLTAARLFVGFPPDASAAVVTAAGSKAAVAAAAAAVGEGGGGGAAAGSVDEPWRVLRLAEAEQQLQGRAVSVQVGVLGYGSCMA
jgi:hypothetical protein